MEDLPAKEIPDLADEEPAGTGSERVFYRDMEEFNKALDAASDSIRKAAGPDVIGMTVWVGLLVVQGLLYTLDWLFDIELRTAVIPGVDLVTPIWIAIVAMIAGDHLWTRNRHGRIIKDRLCLECGASQLGAPVDEAGNGACARCGRKFNLGEYRRPTENRGEHFHGYIDRAHFDKSVFAAAEQIKKMRISGFESDVMGWCWIALGVGVACHIIIDWDPLRWLPGELPYKGLSFAALGLWSWWYTIRVKRIRKAVVKDRLCMNCGYSLLGTDTDERGLGRCPECGTVFSVGQYEAPIEESDEATE
jgi:ribosomal protein L37AE/L43A